MENANKKKKDEIEKRHLTLPSNENIERSYTNHLLVHGKIGFAVNVSNHKEKYSIKKKKAIFYYLNDSVACTSFKSNNIFSLQHLPLLFKIKLAAGWYDRSSHTKKEKSVRYLLRRTGSPVH